MERLVPKHLPVEPAVPLRSRSGRPKFRRRCGHAPLFPDVAAGAADRWFRPVEPQPKTAARPAPLSRLRTPAPLARAGRRPARLAQTSLQAASPQPQSPTAKAGHRNMLAATVQLRPHSCLHQRLFCGALSARASICASLVCNTATYRRQSGRLPAYQGSQLVARARCFPASYPLRLVR